VTSIAESIMRAYNPNALIGQDDDGAICMIEDWADPDGRLYRLEYRSCPTAAKAIAFCHYNPWDENDVSAGQAFDKGHVRARDGFLCLGHGATSDLSASLFPLELVIQRSRYWTCGFSFMLSTNEPFPNP